MLCRELVGIIAFLERFQIEVDEKGNPFVISLLEKQHSRLKLLFDRHVVSDASVFKSNRDANKLYDRLTN